MRILKMLKFATRRSERSAWPSTPRPISNAAIVRRGRQAWSVTAQQQSTED